MSIPQTWLLNQNSTLSFRCFSCCVNSFKSLFIYFFCRFMPFCISKNVWGTITVTESLMFWQRWWGLCFSVSGLTVGLDSDLKEFLDLTSALTIRSLLIVHNHLVQLFVFVKWILMNVIKKNPVTSHELMTPSHSLSLKTANVTSANPFSNHYKQTYTHTYCPYTLLYDDYTWYIPFV